MGPGVLLDKSAVEAIGLDALRVQGDLFSTVIAPVLVWEICGDIEKSKQGKIDVSKVRSLAMKAKPPNSLVPVDYRKLVVGELMGFRASNLPKPGDRVPIVDGAHRVPTERGGHGLILDIQPEADALMRWSRGDWNKEDSKYSEQWRTATKSIDLELFKSRFGPARSAPEDTEALHRLVRTVLADPSLQFFLLQLLLEHSGIRPSRALVIESRWRGDRAAKWQSMCPFSANCLQVVLTFYLALSGGLIGTRSTNRIDLEYFFYTPFAPIFVSGDLSSHGKLAPLLLAPDQLFVTAKEFRDALQSEAERRASLRLSSKEIDVDTLEPPEDSLLRHLWIKSWGYFRKPPSQRIKTVDNLSPTVKSIADRFKASMDLVNANPALYPKRPPWPNP